jgi:hypothetical protein
MVAEKSQDRLECIRLDEVAIESSLNRSQPIDTSE